MNKKEAQQTENRNKQYISAQKLLDENNKILDMNNINNLDYDKIFEKYNNYTCNYYFLIY